MESRIERLCIERGLKMTGQRRVVARVLSEAMASAPSPEYTGRATSVPAMTPNATPSRMQSIATLVA